MRLVNLAILTVLTSVALVGQSAPQQTQTPLPAPPATSAISGVLVDGASGAAVPGAIVTLRGLPTIAIGPQPAQLTDDKGRFAFVNLPAGAGYTISASKFGHLSGGYGRDTSPSDPLKQITLKDNEWVGNVRVQIWKPGSISGMVRDENGEPVVGVFVRALVRYRLGGRDELAAGPTTLTDDRGAYRLAGLGPGRYVVQVPSVQASMSAGTAAPRADTQDGVFEMDDTSRLIIGRYPLPPPALNGRPLAYPMAFHPVSSLLAQAITIELKYGDDRQNMDVALTPASAVRVSGVVEGPPEALTLLTLRLLPAGLENLGHGSETATALVSPNGQFTFLNVPAGNYVIDAPVTVSEFVSSDSGGRRMSFPGPPGTGGYGMTSDAPDPITGLQFTQTSFRGSPANYSARMPLVVAGSDMGGVVVRLRPQLTMTPRFVFENQPSTPSTTGQPQPPPQWLPLILDPAGGEAYLGRPRFRSQADNPNAITIPGVLPGQYWTRLMADGGPWLIKSISWKGRDYTATPIDTSAADDLSDVVITVTNAKPELSGNVRITGEGKPEDSLVVVFPVEQSQWRNQGLKSPRITSTAPGAAGDYRFTWLPAGSYLVAAIDRSRRTTWRDPDSLAQIARTATMVTLTWGGKISQDVSFTPVRK